MLRKVASGVAWAGRTASMVFGVALILALVFGALSVAAAHTGVDARLFHLAHNNLTTALTTLTGNVNGATLQVVNNNADANDTALSLNVQSGEAPMRVNSGTKVANLNADKLDGKDSTSLGVATKTSHQQTGNCDIPNVDNECAKVTVTVPPGKQYHVTVFSSFVAEPQNSDGLLETHIHYCPAIRGGSISSLQCMAPTDLYFSEESGILNEAAISGDMGPLPAGTYTISTLIDPTDTLFLHDGFNAHTTVLVRDASAGLPID